MDIEYAEYKASIGVTHPQDPNYRTSFTTWREDFVNILVKAINDCGIRFEKGDASFISIVPNQDRIDEINERSTG